MNRLLARLATLAVALPLAAGLTTATGHAAESVTVPGCFGFGSTVYCDLTVTVGVPAGVRTYQTDYPVCAGSCVYVPLTFAETAPGEPASVCYSYRRLDYTTVSECVGGGGLGAVDTVLGIVEESGGAVIETVLGLLERPTVRELLETNVCHEAAGIVNDLGEIVYCEP